MNAATKAKMKYNKKTYDKAYLCMRKAHCKEFKEKCRKEGVSQAEVLRTGIREFMGWDEDMKF